MAVPGVACLAVAEGILYVALPRGFAIGGQRLDLIFQLALMGGALAAGAWAAFSGKQRRVLLGGVLALALLAPAYDPRAPLERLPAYLAAAILVLLFLEFALLNAKMAKLAKLPRAHVTQGSQAREVDLRATAARIAQSWPVPLGAGVVVLLGMVGLQQLIAAVAPRALGDSVEMRGPFGLGLAAMALLGLLGVIAWRRQRAQLGGSGGEGGGSPEGGSDGAGGAPGSGGTPGS
jgi:uncharacterized membrane protein YgcG